MAQYTNPDVFVFLDESAVDQGTAHRTHGRSKPGTRCVRRMTFIRGVRHSILPALTLDGIIGLDIFEGSVNKDRFLLFLRDQVAPQLNPYPGKRSVVVLDNCSIHHDEEIRQLIVDDCSTDATETFFSMARADSLLIGARLVYLPPYSPNFNPIEEAFSAIKAWL